MPNTGPNPGPGLTDDGHPAPKLKFKYDAAGRLVESSSPGASTDQNPAADRVTNFTYDVLGRQVQQEAPADGQNKRVATLTKYDLRDNVRSVTISAPATIAGNQSLPAVELVTTNFHDLRNRLVAIDHPGASPSEDRLLTFYSYNKAGELLGELTVEGSEPLALLGGTAWLPPAWFQILADSYAADPHRITRYEYDSLGRVTKTIGTDPDGPGGNSAATTEYKYDAASNVTQTKLTATDAVEGELTRITDVEYDNLDRPWRTLETPVKLDPLDEAAIRPESILVYNVGGTVRKQLTKNVTPDQDEIDGQWRQTTFDYDNLGRQYRSVAPHLVSVGQQQSPEGDSWSITSIEQSTPTDIPSYSFRDAASNIVLSVTPWQRDTITDFDQTTTKFDLLNRPVQTVGAASGQVENSQFATGSNLRYNTDGSIREQWSTASGGESGKTTYT